MDIKLLGPLRVSERDVAISPTAAKQRKLLAVLAINANEVVPVSTLFEELWGENIPRTASTTVHVYVMQLRKRIGAAMDRGSDLDPKQIIVTHSGGYCLQDPAGTVDTHEFERFAAAGHRAREAGDFPTASRNFAEALTLWRGPALVDVPTGPVLEVHVRRLEEQRRNVLDRRIDADLRVGRHHELLGELAGLVARHRTHEGMHMQLMLALSRSGRRGDVLDVYRRLHTCLGDIGLAPSARMNQLLRSLLAAEHTEAVPQPLNA